MLLERQFVLVVVDRKKSFECKTSLFVILLSVKELPKLFHKVEYDSGLVGFTINNSKTKVMIVDMTGHLVLTISGSFFFSLCVIWYIMGTLLQPSRQVNLQDKYLSLELIVSCRSDIIKIPKFRPSIDEL